MERVRTLARRAPRVVGRRFLRRQGFSETAADEWVGTIARDWKQHGFTRAADLVRAHGSGDSLPAHELRSAQNTPVARISERDFYARQPFDARRSWLRSRIIADRVVPGITASTPTILCTISRGREGLEVVRLRAYPADLGPTGTDLLELVRREKSVRVAPVQWGAGDGVVLAWDGESFRIEGADASDSVAATDGAPASDSAVLARLDELAAERRCVVLRERTADTGDVFRLLAAREGLAPARVIAAERRRGKRGAKATRAERRSDVPAALVSGVERLLSQDESRFRLLSIDVRARRGDGDFTILDIVTKLPYPRAGMLDDDGWARLTAAIEDASAVREYSLGMGATVRRARTRMHRLKRKVHAFQLRSTGFSRRMAHLWVKQINNDNRRNADLPSHVRARHHRSGFVSTTVSRFGITPENAGEFISTRDYLLAEPLNETYGKWVRDRVSSLTVFEPFADRFETMHYQVMQRDGGLHIVPLTAEARECGTDIAGLAALLARTGPLAMASAAWSGRRPRMVAHTGESFTIDGKEYSDDEFDALLTQRVRGQFFVLYEPVEPAGPLTELVDGGDVHLQVTMMNPGGGDPQVAEAFVVATDSVDAPQIRRLVESDDAGLRMIGGDERRGNGVDTEEIDAYLSRLEHRADAEVRSDATAESWVEGDEETAVQASARLRFESRIDADTGDFDGARAVIGGQLWCLEKHPGTEQRFAGRIAEWQSVRSLLVDLCAFAPQLKFVQFTVTLSARGPVITNVSATPRYNKEFPYLPATVEFLREHIEKKRQRTHTLQARVRRWLHNAKLRLRRSFARALYPEGLVPYQSVRWLEDMARDLIQRNGVPLKTKIWAYRNGFLSYRIPQYGITPENRTQFISDFEYRWLRHINKKYKYWLEDKISIKYVAAEFNEFLPGYYYYTSQRGGRAHLIPMMDRPEGYGETFDEVLRLARDKGVLALKPDEGSHGDGFYRLGYEDGGYTLNGEAATGEQVLDIISDPQNRYLITEFIVMHPTLAEIYPQSVNTVRMTVFKKDGVTPQIGNAYLRVGSSASGYVDNTAAGGLLVEVDIESGRYGNAQALDGGRVVPCPRHPDTGVLMEGVMPNWEFAKQKVLEMAESIPQLEYLGFDLAMTEDSFKLPEINRFPDFPRIDKLTPEIIDYLLYKLEKKKRLFGYDVNPPRKLISLPKR
ncbi:sugar-transfer associated ATP-grasp domain-containing protein [Brevibacterium yomogidense]|nr:sugar-transfer associated ATP-grasp domain-containing protein [Brevibacterium yomogidense]